VVLSNVQRSILQQKKDEHFGTTVSTDSVRMSGVTLMSISFKFSHLYVFHSHSSLTTIHSTTTTSISFSISTAAFMLPVHKHMHKQENANTSRRWLAHEELFRLFYQREGRSGHTPIYTVSQKQAKLFLL